MLRGHVFKFQTFANEAFAHFINTFLQGNMGVTKGCSLSKTNDSVTIGAGYFCVMGRFLEIVGNETISNITNTGYYQLICEIDLTKTNTSSELNQAVIKLIRNTSAYSNLTKEDLFNGGTLYQYEFARFKVTEQGIIDFSDRRTFLNLTSLYSQINSNFNSLFNAKDQEAEALLEEIRQELENVIDGSAYLLKEGGTMTGDLGMNNSTIKIASGTSKGIQNSSNKPILRDHGNGNVTVDATDDTLFLGFENTQRINLKGKVTVENDGGIYWKESGYGDKFKIVPNFNGADDNNLLKIQGAAGAAGTDPTLQDLVNITAKSGNVTVKGNVNAPNFDGKTNGFEWDINTANTSGTWFLVMNGMKIQHRAMNTIIPAIAVLTGNTSINASSNKTIEITYPSGYTKDNSILLACGLSLVNDPYSKGYNYYGLYNDSSDILSYALRRRVNLASSKILLTVYNPVTDQAMNVQYKLVLMKIS